LFTDPLLTFPENLRKSVWKFLCKVANRQKTDKQTTTITYPAEVIKFWYWRQKAGIKAATPIPSVKLAVSEEMMRPHHCLRLVHCCPFSALFDMDGFLTGRTTTQVKTSIPQISRGSLLEQVEDEDPTRN